MIVKVRLLLLPDPSVAVVVTVVVPTGNKEPDGGVLTVETVPLTRSLAEVAKVTLAPLRPLASTVMLAGTLIEGAVVSTTFTAKTALPVLPAASVEEAVTLVFPSGNIEPEAGVFTVGSTPST